MSMFIPSQTVQKRVTGHKDICMQGKGSSYGLAPSWWTHLLLYTTDKSKTPLFNEQIRKTPTYES